MAARWGRAQAFPPKVLPLFVALFGALSACAAPGSDIHLAPVYSRLNTANDFIATEAAGGFWRHRRRAHDDSLERMTLGPLYGIHYEENGDWTANFLVPFGYTRKKGQEKKSYLFFVYYWQRRVEVDGTKTVQWISLPLIMYHGNEKKGGHFGWFPFYGDFRDFVTFDRVRWFLWPIIFYRDRAGIRTYNFIWPIFGWNSGNVTGFHVWPFYGHVDKQGRYERTYIGWPIFHHQKNNLGGGNEEPETVLMLWPLIGYKKRGTYRAWTSLWPFFGYSYDPRSGFWALDFPWFLIRFQRGPDEVSRSRVWPFFGYLHAGGLTSWTFLWPIFHIRKEETDEISRRSFHAIPFWRSWDATYKATGETAAWRKLWPLYQYERWGDYRHGFFPTLDPFWRNPTIDRFFAWIWALYEWESQGEMYRSRSWLGLYRRERGRGEDRRSLAGLWSSRRYSSGGRRVKETSLLFGLFRWRVTEDEGLDMLRPAFPGPGWPAQVGQSSAGDG